MRHTLVILVLIVASFGAAARDVCPSLVSDTLNATFQMPRGQGYVRADRNFTGSVSQMFRALDESGCELLRVIVSGSSSPDGLWGNNIALSKARTDNAAEYFRSVMNVPYYKIDKVDLMEDWGRLAAMVAASDMRYKEEVLEIIREKTWGERKTALKKLDGGRVWNILEDHFFPELRCVNVSVVYKGDIKASEPEERHVCTQVDTLCIRDTVYVMDTVYVFRDVPSIEAESPSEVQEVAEIDVKKKEHGEWLMGVKTNLLYDAAALYSLGLEVQLARHMSLDCQVFGSSFNIFVPEDKGTAVLGFSPELRWWFGDGIMRKGSFIGAYADLAWYSIQWKDGMLYQNGTIDAWTSRGLDMKSAPAWSAGLAYGYSLGLGKKQRWGLEFYVGAGYFSMTHNNMVNNAQQEWKLKENKRVTGFSVTKAGVNLTYRFSLR